MHVASSVGPAGIVHAAFPFTGRRFPLYPGDTMDEFGGWWEHGDTLGPNATGRLFLMAWIYDDTSDGHRRTILVHENVPGSTMHMDNGVWNAAQSSHATNKIIRGILAS